MGYLWEYCWFLHGETIGIWYLYFLHIPTQHIPWISYMGNLTAMGMLWGVRWYLDILFIAESPFVVFSCDIAALHMALSVGRSDSVYTSVSAQ